MFIYRPGLFVFLQLSFTFFMFFSCFMFYVGLLIVRLRFINDILLTYSAVCLINLITLLTY